MIPDHQLHLRVAALAEDPAALEPLRARLVALGTDVVATAALPTAPAFEGAQIEVRVALLEATLSPTLQALGALGAMAPPPVLLLYPTLILRQVLAACGLGVSGHALTSVADADLALGLATVARGALFFCPSLWHAFRQQYLAPRAPLTAEELQLIHLASTGESNQALAAALGVTEKMVEYRLRQLCAKLGLANKIELAAWWGRRLVERVEED